MSEFPEFPDDDQFRNMMLVHMASNIAKNKQNREDPASSLGILIFIFLFIGGIVAFCMGIEEHPLLTWITTISVLSFATLIWVLMEIITSNNYKPLKLVLTIVFIIGIVAGVLILSYYTDRINHPYSP